jgi:S1-C subfamily serine protease|tara:strand:+ start:1203 stop:2552 length:1350 start_codon:yes stop_codon:yes gene_type:complete
MKKFLSFLSIAILGGVISLIGYSAFIEKPQVVSTDEMMPIQTFQTNYNSTAFDLNTATYAPTNFTEAAEKTVHAVVHVKNTAVSSGINSISDLFNGPRKYQQIGTGSGVIISSDGYIVTNNHVIDGASELEITLNNRKKYKATLIGTDKKNDIALLKIEATDPLPYIPFSDSDTIKIGEWVLAVGNPYNLTSTVTAGIVSAKGRDLQGNSATDSFIQTDAAVNPGNSGGALVNTRGELVGINTAISSKTGSYIGYSFAVPSNIAKKIIDDILEFGKVQEAIIGFMPDLREDDIEGVRIGDFAENSNAEKAGLKRGDVIVQIDDVKISKFSELSGQLSAKRPGESVNLTINREGEVFSKNIQLIKRIERFISRAYGLELKDDSQGAKIIREASNGSNSSSLVGYVITEVNDQKITSASEAVALLDGLSRNGYRIKVKIIDLNGERGTYFF